MTSDHISRLASLLRYAVDRKHMIIMIGGPASGKGHNSGPGGLKLPQFTQGLIKSDDVPKGGGVTEEGDSSLRLEQREAAKEHYHNLSKAKESGSCDTELEDHWYQTKDGDKKNLSDSIACDELPGDFDAFFDNKQVGDFYISMRSWQDDVTKTHESPPSPPELEGKPVERFKDRARHTFDRRVKNMVESDDAGFLVLDSAGEDIDVQDFEGQIKHAQANGFEVTVVHLDIDPRDTKLANKLRGAKGDRMVDEADIDNYFKKESKELKDLLGAHPDRYLHFKRTTEPLTDKDRAATEKLIKELDDARLADAPKEERKAIEKKVQAYTFRPQYEIQLDTSDLISKSYSAESVEKVLRSIGKPVDDVGKPAPDVKKEDGPSYDRYIERKKQKGERPLSKEDWEARVMPKAASENIRRLARVVVAWRGLDKVIYDIVQDVEKKVGKKYEGYDVEYDTGRTDFYIHLLGGASSGMRDITTLKKLRKVVTPIFEKQIRAYDSKYSPKITASSHGDDLVIHCSVNYS